MAELGTVTRVDPLRGICRVRVEHPDCGHCAEGSAGHCGRRKHELELRVPAELQPQVREGCRVRFRIPAAALVRGLMRLLVWPVVAGGAGMWLLWTWAEQRPDPALWHGLLAAAGSLAALALATLIGQQPGEEPVVAEVPGGGVPVLRPWDPADQR